MAHIVVLGAGLGGVPAAYEIRRHLGDGHRVTLIGATEYFEFTPSNPWVAVGWRDTADTRVALARPMARKGIEYVVGWASRIDAEDRRVVLADGREIAYDHLVVTTGPQLAFDEVPGLGPAGHTHSVCTHEHSRSAWTAYEKFLEQPGPVVVGAAPGASCFGPAYEFAMIVDADLRRRKLRDRVPMWFVTSEPYVGHMGLGGVGDSKGLMESKLRAHHVKVVANARIVGVEPGRMRVEEVDDGGATRREHALDFAYAMVIPAFRGVEAVAQVPGLCNARGFVIVDPHQRSPKYPSIWSAGVCIAIPPVEATPVPTGAPKTGYMIESMVGAIAMNLAAELAGQPVTAVASWNAICLADFGDDGAAFVALPQIPPRNVTWTRMGWWVHAAKIAFEKYFIRKVRVGSVTPVYERYVLKLLGIATLKEKVE